MPPKADLPLGKPDDVNAGISAGVLPLGIVAAAALTGPAARAAPWCHHKKVSYVLP